MLTTVFKTILINTWNRPAFCWQTWAESSAGFTLTFKGYPLPLQGKHPVPKGLGWGSGGQCVKTIVLIRDVFSNFAKQRTFWGKIVTCARQHGAFWRENPHSLSFKMFRLVLFPCNCVGNEAETILDNITSSLLCCGGHFPLRPLSGPLARPLAQMGWFGLTGRTTSWLNRTHRNATNCAQAWLTNYALW